MGRGDLYYKDCFVGILLAMTIVLVSTNGRDFDIRKFNTEEVAD